MLGIPVDIAYLFKIKNKLLSLTFNNIISIKFKNYL